MHYLPPVPHPISKNCCTVQRHCVNHPRLLKKKKRFWAARHHPYLSCLCPLVNAATTTWPHLSHPAAKAPVVASPRSSGTSIKLALNSGPKRVGGIKPLDAHVMHPEAAHGCFWNKSTTRSKCRNVWNSCFAVLSKISCVTIYNIDVLQISVEYLWKVSFLSGGTRTLGLVLYFEIENRKFVYHSRGLVGKFCALKWLEC